MHGRPRHRGHTVATREFDGLELREGAFEDVEAGVPRFLVMRLTRWSTHVPAASIDMGFFATYRRPKINAIAPASDNTSVTGLIRLPTANAPIMPTDARVTAAMTPETASCHEATTGVAPHLRVCL